MLARRAFAAHESRVGRPRLTFAWPWEQPARLRRILAIPGLRGRRNSAGRRRGPGLAPGFTKPCEAKHKYNHGAHVNICAALINGKATGSAVPA